MRAIEILKRGVQQIKNNDKTYSHTGRPDFSEEENSDIKKFGPRGPYSRPRTKVSQNNSYT